MEFTAVYNHHAPAIINWINTTLDLHSQNKTAVSASNHKCLRDYFPAVFLDKTYVVYVDEVPVVPLYLTGIPQLDLMSQF